MSAIRYFLLFLSNIASNGKSHNAPSGDIIKELLLSNSLFRGFFKVKSYSCANLSLDAFVNLLHFRQKQKNS